MTWTSNTRRCAGALVPTIALLAGTIGLAGCGDKDVNVIAPLPVPVVTTFKDGAFDFTTLHTFSMPDTVVHFNPVTGTPIDVSRQFDAVALNQVRNDLLARGYTQITNPATVRPDFVILVGATATENYNAFVGYSWDSIWGFYAGWGWYAPGFTPAWGIIYPWYPTVGVTSYDRGTLVVDLIPTSSVNPDTKTIRSAWAGVATAALTGNVTATTVAAAVNQMFALSPYLTATPLVATPH